MPRAAKTHALQVRSPLLKKDERVVGVRVDKGGIILRSTADAKAHAEARSRQLLGVSSSVAFKMLASGKLKGTAAEAEVTLLRRIVEHKS